MLTALLSIVLLLGVPLGIAAFLYRFFSGGTKIAVFISTFLAPRSMTSIAGAAVLFNWLSTRHVHIN